MNNKTAMMLPTIKPTQEEKFYRGLLGQGLSIPPHLSRDMKVNGHTVCFVPPSIKTYWGAYYTWNGFNYLCRGSFEECVDAAVKYYSQGHKGSAVYISCQTPEQVAYCESKGFILDEKKKCEPTVFDDCLVTAIRMVKEGGNASSILALMKEATSHSDFVKGYYHG